VAAQVATEQLAPSTASGEVSKLLAKYPGLHSGQDMVSLACRKYILRYIRYIYALLFFHGLLITLVGI
jgi:hypothetical protein